jgi:Peptidase inhibitor I78 family
MIARAACLVLALAAAACATAPADIPDTGPALPPLGEDTCGARRHADLIGKPASSPGVPPESRMVRHLHPESIATMDLRQDRLNVMIDRDDRIYALRCY